MDDEEISIQSFNELVKHLNNNKEFSVWWDVLCEIGPEWIGSRREICFVLDGKPLSDSNFHTYLKNQLVNVADIPKESTNYVIQGEGDISLKNGQLIIDYWWSAMIPYQNSDQSGYGKGVLHG